MASGRDKVLVPNAHKNDKNVWVCEYARAYGVCNKLCVEFSTLAIISHVRSKYE